MSGSACLGRPLALILVILFVCLTTPLDAEAQGWEWIRKLSGPGFNKTVTGRGAFCVFGENCVDGAGGSFVAEKIVTRDGDDDSNARQRERPGTRGQFGVVVTYGWDGENEEAQISGVNILKLEEQFAILPDWGVWYVPRVFSMGIGFNRFSGTFIDAPFWRTSLEQTVLWRYYFHGNQALQNGTYVEVGPKFSYFFTHLESQEFGGIPEFETPEGGEWGLSLSVRVGHAFRWR